MKLKIIDTGYVSTTVALSSQTQLPAADRAGFNGTSSVNVLELPHILKSLISGSSNNNDSPQIGTGKYTEISSNSFENEQFVLQVGIKRDELPTGTFDINYIVQVNRLKQTNGIKLLYFEGDGNFNSALKYYADSFTGGVFSPSFIDTDKPYIPVKVVDITFEDIPESKYIRVNLTLRVTR